MKLLICYLLIMGFNAIVAILLLLGRKWYNESAIPFNQDETVIEKELKSKQFWIYIGWAALQQAIVISIYTLLIYYLKWLFYVTIPVCAGLFLILHYPNVLLQFAVFGMELILLLMLYVGGWFIIPGIIFTHAFLAVLLYNNYPESITKNFQVLWSYFKEYKK